jgi:hypothetical protein
MSRALPADRDERDPIDAKCPASIGTSTSFTSGVPALAVAYVEIRRGIVRATPPKAVSENVLALAR